MDFINPLKQVFCHQSFREIFLLGHDKIGDNDERDLADHVFKSLDLFFLLKKKEKRKIGMGNL